MQAKKVGVGVGIMILKRGKVLLGKRNSDPRKADSELHGAGTWTMPGGKVHFGEGLKEAAFREVQEETGIKVKKGKLKLISVSNDIVQDAHFVTLGFLCQDFLGKPKVKEPEEITEWRWFPLNKLPKPLFFPSAKILKNYLAKSIYRK